MKTVILAGGRDTRIAAVKPKPLAEVESTTSASVKSAG
jgi:GTP:adenosylcobinamide-phosphate guanylyltransferase